MIEDPLGRQAQYFLMIECEGRWARDNMPGYFFRVVCCFSFRKMVDHCSKCDTHRMTPRVAAGVSERADLCELNSSDAGFLAQLASGCRLQRFVFIDKPARQSPLAFERRAPAFDQQDMETAFRAMEQNYVDGDGRTRMVVAVFPASLRFLHQSLQSGNGAEIESADRHVRRSNLAMNADSQTWLFGFAINSLHRVRISLEYFVFEASEDHSLDSLFAREQICRLSDCNLASRVNGITIDPAAYRGEGDCLDVVL
jgi:hypothetical protein